MRGTSTRGAYGGRRATRSVGLVGVTSTLALLAAGCSSEPPAQPVAVKLVPPVTVMANPANGARDVLTSVVPLVTASNGKLTGVVVRDGKGRVISGRLASTGGSWQATGPLVAGRAYTVQATGLDGAGRPFQRLTTFHTIKPKKIAKASVSPLAGQTVGIGQPISVTFSKPVTDKATVEGRLSVETSKPIVGAWHWISDTNVRFRPREYWPANTDVTLRTNLKDVNVGNDIWGDENREIKFRIGRAQVSVVDTDTYTMTVYRNGKKVKVFPVTTGKPGFRTRSGKKVVLGYERHKTMDARSIGISPGASEYYLMHVDYAVRVTWSGEFVHAAPWSAGSHGRENASHGCVGMSTTNAKWFYDHTIVGDIVDTKGSKKKMELTNGYGDWNMRWAKWVAGSALGGQSAPAAPASAASRPTLSAAGSAPAAGGGPVASGSAAPAAPAGKLAGDDAAPTTPAGSTTSTAASPARRTAAVPPASRDD